MSNLEEKLIENRIVFISGEINEDLANNVISTLLYLDSVGNEDISLYINSPGGSVTQGLAIIDTMNFIKSNIRTYCLGHCASMAAIILACGTKGKRFVLPNSEIMIHQPSGGAYGKSDDVVISCNRLKQCKEKLISILTSATKKNKREITRYLNNDYYMGATDAIEFGIVDKLIFKSS